MDITTLSSTQCNHGESYNLTKIQETVSSEGDRENSTVNTALIKGFGRMTYREQNSNTARWVSGVILHAINNI